MGTEESKRIHRVVTELQDDALRMRLAARYAGTCAGCGGSFGRGADVWYVPAVRGRGVCYCGECGGQYARDIAADDFDLANNRCM